MTTPTQSAATALTERFLRDEVAPCFARVLEAERERGEVYLANHSLGRPPDRMADDVARALALWYKQMDAAWAEWMAEAEWFQSGTGSLIGLPHGGAVVAKGSAGQGVRAVLNAVPKEKPLRVVTTTGEFDSVDFILKSYAEQGKVEVHWVEPSAHEGDVPLFEAGPVLAAIGKGADLVVISQVFFMTGQVMPGLEEIAAEARRHGALSLVDAYHAVGAMPVQMAALGCDFMVGGSYKYTRGGPGAAWLALAPTMLDREDIRTLDTGWFAKKDPMAFARPETPLRGEGGMAWMESTPPFLAPYQAKAGLELTLELGPERLRTYSLERQALVRGFMRARKVEMVEPTDPQCFGAFSLLVRQDASAFAKKLKESGVNVDFRGRFVRFCPDILNTEDELERAAEITAALIERDG